MGDDLMTLEECLCACRYEDTEPLTMNQRLWEAGKVIVLSAVAASVVALAAIGSISVWLSVYLS